MNGYCIGTEDEMILETTFREELEEQDLTSVA
jgi:hypothetical protein